VLAEADWLCESDSDFDVLDEADWLDEEFDFSNGILQYISPFASADNWGFLAPIIMCGIPPA
jgi:hypothetical protein